MRKEESQIKAALESDHTSITDARLTGNTERHRGPTLITNYMHVSFKKLHAYIKLISHDYSLALGMCMLV